MAHPSASRSSGPQSCRGMTRRLRPLGGCQEQSVHIHVREQIIMAAKKNTTPTVPCRNCTTPTAHPLCPKCLEQVSKALTALPHAMALSLDLMAHPAPKTTEGRASSSHPGINLDVSLLTWRTHATRHMMWAARWITHNHPAEIGGDPWLIMWTHLDDWVTEPGADRFIADALGLYASSQPWATH